MLMSKTGERDRTADLPFTRGTVALRTMIQHQQRMPRSPKFTLVIGLVKAIVAAMPEGIA
jgi:hypothetical protein